MSHKAASVNRRDVWWRDTPAGRVYAAHQRPTRGLWRRLRGGAYVAGDYILRPFNRRRAWSVDLQFQDRCVCATNSLAAAKLYAERRAARARQGGLWE